MEFCPHCMRPSEGSFCGICGKPMDVASAPGQLPLGTVLNGTVGAYQLGAAVRHGEKGITYAAMDVKNSRRVKIREFFPAACSLRQADNSIAPITGDEESFRAALGVFYQKAAKLEAEGVAYETFESNGTAYVAMEFSDAPPVKTTSRAARAAKTAPRAPTAAKPRNNKMLPWVVLAAAVVVLLSVLGIVGCMVFSDDVTDEGFVYEIVGDHAEITAYEGKRDSAAVPETIEGYPVKIKGSAFDTQDRITSLTIPATVQAEPEAFASCRSLRCIALTGIIDQSDDWSALSYARSLYCIVLPDQASFDAYADHFQNLCVSNPELIVCAVGQETGFGQIMQVEVHSDVIVQITNQNYAVIAYVPPHATEPAVLGGYTVIPSNDSFADYEKDGSVDSFDYAISSNQRVCAIVGYSGQNVDLTIPEELDGRPVTVIAPNAFADLTSLRSVHMGDITVKERAFAGCTGLKVVTVDRSDLNVTAFEGCTSLRAGMYTGADPFAGMNLPEQFRAYPSVLEGVGELALIDVIDEVIYANTAEKAVVLHIPGGKPEVEIKKQHKGVPVSWICSGALDNAMVGIKIQLPDETLYDESLYTKANWNCGAYTLAECWGKSCEAAEKINMMRGANEHIRPDPQLLRAAMARATELKVRNDTTRPNGSSWTSILDDNGIAWDYATGSRGESEIADFDLILNDLYTYCASAETAQEVAGRFYDKIALGYDWDEENKMAYMAALTIISP